ncbi:MAG: hypothetical protein K940chlam1_00493 [Candidatus Anoxychlamydiales bacterium]|nr:hypothetical protein [Candidatus Anoxychlamydiales bacterium]NGX35983.1 hypothetical protein [Candidatus Anoxychlamydiales bacterium]
MTSVSSVSSTSNVDSIFYLDAKKYTKLSLEALKDKKYLESWLFVVPAKVNYLADSILNVGMTFVALGKILFGSLYSLYTWTRETTLLDTGKDDLYRYTNNALSSAIGIVLTEKGKSLRNNNNVSDLLIFATWVSFASLLIIGASNAPGFKTFFNPNCFLMKPAPGWKL